MVHSFILQRDKELSITCELRARSGPSRDAPIERGADLMDCWKTIFDDWPSANKYAFFLYDLAGPIPYSEFVQYTDVAAGPFKFALVKGPAVTVSIPQGMTVVPGTAVRAEQYCVELSGLNAAVPEVAAHICAGGFAGGLLTRLILQRLIDTNAAPLPSLPKTPVMIRKIQDPTITRRASMQWTDFVATITKFAPFQIAGACHGWEAGTDLISFGDKRKYDATWRIFASRYSWTEMGEVVGYSLNYLLGYLRCQVALQSKHSTPPASDDPRAIHALLAQDSNSRGVELVIGELFGRLIKQLTAAHEKDPKAAENFANFLVGFERGTLKSAELVFVDAFSLGYGLGYADGFNDGYSRGYADGYQKGYDDASTTTSWGGIFGALSDCAKIAGAVSEVIALFA